MTSTLGSVVSNVIVLVTTLAAMIASSGGSRCSRCGAAGVHRPGPRVGRRLQAISREQMGVNAEMNSQMTERFNVSGRSW